MKVVIHYEDSPLAGGPKPPPLHRLVLRSVADLRSIPDIGLRLLEKLLIHSALDGAGNLRKGLCDHARLNRLRQQGVTTMFFLFDLDRAPKLVPIRATCKSDLKKELSRLAGDPADLRILFLADHLESLLRCLRELEPELLTPPAWEAAIDRKKLFDRDVALSKAAAPSLRTALLQHHPSWPYAIRAIAASIDGANLVRDLSAAKAAPPPHGLSVNTRTTAASRTRSRNRRLATVVPNARPTSGPA